MRAKYVLSEVFVGLWRNISMTVAMIITMAVSLTMLGAGLVLYLTVQDMEEQFRGELEVIFFLEKELEEGDDEQVQLNETLLADDRIEHFDFKNKEAAWSNFQELFSDAPDLVDSVDPERLPASFDIKLHDMEADAEAFIADYEDHEGVERVVNQRDTMEQVFDLLGGLQKLALIIALVQGIAALMLVANTIQVAAYSKRREVSIMKLVGASNWFVQAPFVLEAVFAGVLGAVVSFAALAGGKMFLVDGAFESVFALLPNISWTRILLMLPILAGISSLISAITGWITLRFQVKV